MKIVQQYVLGSADVLQVEEVAIPTIEEHEVLIKGYFTSVNFADIKARTGVKGEPTFPFTIGLDLVGEIVESNSVNFKVGQKVMAFPKNGSYREYAVASEQLTFLLPDEIDIKQVAAMPTVMILSYILLTQIAQVKEKDTIVVHSASGGVGSSLIQLALIIGVKQIIGTVGSVQKASFVEGLGADAVYTYDDFVEGVNAITNGKGADVIFDSVAGEVTAKSLHCLANYGTLVQFGNSSGQPGTFSTNDVHNSCRNVKGFSLGTTRKEDPSRLKPVVEKIISYIEKGMLQVPIERIYSLNDIQEAHQLMESRAHQGKILIQLNDGA
ncbi:zinc-binding dehydrogenase [Solibacillus sp. MA9]|uniref:Zinc-binding dehydrogenase n=1 Tax=Solibacillus palustris TaxID=2908203 RepID=A0ABS9UA25_9BACL|nr:zinc-binding dehydrogenase [Solibacillus sp. MA9]MCH7321187.1 zinc-binding dehydrogenase [Solibacillus sp. MA9]